MEEQINKVETQNQIYKKQNLELIKENAKLKTEAHLKDMEILHLKEKLAYLKKENERYLHEFVPETVSDEDSRDSKNA